MGFKLVRALLGMTQQELAALAGMARPTLVRWESEGSNGASLPMCAVQAILKAIEEKYQCPEPPLLFLAEVLKVDDKSVTFDDELQKWVSAFDELAECPVFTISANYLNREILQTGIPDRPIPRVRVKTLKAVLERQAAKESVEPEKKEEASCGASSCS